MTAPQIPNLLDGLRASRIARGNSSRSHARENLSSFRSPQARREPSAPSADAIVQQTDDDAAGSRLSAVEAGYLQDDFARVFAPPGMQVGVRRMPVINRGTYVRTVAIDALVDDFLSSNGITPGSSEEEEQWAVEEQKGGKQGMKVQILSLGAGTDTRFFRLQQRYGRRLARRLHYHELDFPSTARRKIDAIERASWVGRLLRDAADEAVADTTSRRQDHTGDKSPVRINADKTSLTSPAYTFHALDLRRLSESTVDPADLLSDVEPNVPTLILSECCLTYLPITTANAILARLARFLQPSAPAPPSQSSQMSNAQHSQAPSSPAKAVPNPGKQPHHCPDHTLAVLLYEPLHPADAFGRTMHSNLAARGISLPSLEALPTLEAHQTRLRSVLGAPEGEFSGIKFPGEERSDGGMSEAKGAQGAVSVRRWWEREVSEGERERLRRCEGLDEEEEWELLAEHYGFVWGWRGGEVGGRWFVCGEEGDGGR